MKSKLHLQINYSFFSPRSHLQNTRQTATYLISVGSITSFCLIMSQWPAYCCFLIHQKCILPSVKQLFFSSVRKTRSWGNIKKLFITTGNLSQMDLWKQIPPYPWSTWWGKYFQKTFCSWNQWLRNPGESPWLCFPR